VVTSVFRSPVAVGNGKLYFNCDATIESRINNVASGFLSKAALASRVPSEVFGGDCVVLADADTVTVTTDGRVFTTNQIQHHGVWQRDAVSGAWLDEPAYWARRQNNAPSITAGPLGQGPYGLTSGRPDPITQKREIYGAFFGDCYYACQYGGLARYQVDTTSTAVQNDIFRLTCVYADPITIDPIVWGGRTSGFGFGDTSQIVKIDLNSNAIVAQYNMGIPNITDFVAADGDLWVCCYGLSERLIEGQDYPGGVVRFNREDEEIVTTLFGEGMPRKPSELASNGTSAVWTFGSSYRVGTGYDVIGYESTITKIATADNTPEEIEVGGQPVSIAYAANFVWTVVIVNPGNTLYDENGDLLPYETRPRWELVKINASTNAIVERYPFPPDPLPIGPTPGLLLGGTGEEIPVVSRMRYLEGYLWITLNRSRVLSFDPTSVEPDWVYAHFLNSTVQVVANYTAADQIWDCAFDGRLIACSSPGTTSTEYLDPVTRLPVDLGGYFSYQFPFRGTALRQGPDGNLYLLSRDTLGWGFNMPAVDAYPLWLDYLYGYANLSFDNVYGWGAIDKAAIPRSRTRLHRIDPNTKRVVATVRFPDYVMPTDWSFDDAGNILVVGNFGFYPIYRIPANFANATFATGLGTLAPRRGARSALSYETYVGETPRLIRQGTDILRITNNRISGGSDLYSAYGRDVSVYDSNGVRISRTSTSALAPATGLTVNGDHWVFYRGLSHMHGHIMRFDRSPSESINGYDTILNSIAPSPDSGVFLSIHRDVWESGGSTYQQILGPASGNGYGGLGVIVEINNTNIRFRAPDADREIPLSTFRDNQWVQLAILPTIQWDYYYGLGTDFASQPRVIIYTGEPLRIRNQFPYVPSLNPNSFSAIYESYNFDKFSGGDGTARLDDIGIGGSNTGPSFDGRIAYVGSFNIFYEEPNGGPIFTQFRAIYQYGFEINTGHTTFSLRDHTEGDTSWGALSYPPYLGQYLDARDDTFSEYAWNNGPIWSTPSPLNVPRRSQWTLNGGSIAGARPGDTGTVTFTSNKLVPNDGIHTGTGITRNYDTYGLLTTFINQNPYYKDAIFHRQNSKYWVLLNPRYRSGNYEGLYEAVIGAEPNWSNLCITYNPSRTGWTYGYLD
jgi:hypothetical protein